ncbi:MAG: hypothetical protein H6555_12060 [Lewinellaceae bacterium]|nr:hypothetical protein [Lewinellaceae bacterium]
MYTSGAIQRILFSAFGIAGGCAGLFAQTGAVGTYLQSTSVYSLDALPVFTITQPSPVALSCLSPTDLSQLPVPALVDEGNLLETYTYQDQEYTLSDAQQGFTGYFSATNWRLMPRNGSAITVAGAIAPFNIDNPSQQIKLIAGQAWEITMPADGYLVLDWEGASQARLALVSSQGERQEGGPGAIYSGFIPAGETLQIQLLATGNQPVALQGMRFLTQAYTMIERHWVATAQDGREAQVSQYIAFYRPALMDVRLPADQLDALGQVSPIYTGSPYLEFEDRDASVKQVPLSTAQQCGFSANYRDEWQLDSRGQAIVIRHWTVTDAVGQNVLQGKQKISLPGGVTEARDTNSKHNPQRLN